MDNRQFEADAKATPPTAPASPSAGYPTNGDPLSAQNATGLGEWWFHAVGEELRAVIVEGGLTPNISTLTQLRDAIKVISKRNMGYMLVQDQKANGTAGGSSVVGIQTRVLNTVVKNTIVGASLSANQITLPAGGFRVNARAPAFFSQHRCQIFNVTNNVVHTYGSNANGLNATTAASIGGDPVQTESFVSAYIELVEPTTFSLKSYCSEANATNGLGQASVEAIGEEIYSSIEIVQDY